MNTTRQAIIGDDEVSKLIEFGPGYVNNVKEKHRAVSTAEKIHIDFVNNGLKTAQERLEEQASIVAFEISQDATLSNDTKRKAALVKRLNEDEEYQKIAAEIKAMNLRKSDLEQAIQLAKIEYEGARNALAMWHSQMAVIAGLSREVAQQVEFRHTLTAEVRSE